MVSITFYHSFIGSNIYKNRHIKVVFRFRRVSYFTQRLGVHVIVVFDRFALRVKISRWVNDHPK